MKTSRLAVFALQAIAFWRAVSRAQPAAGAHTRPGTARFAPSGWLAWWGMLACAALVWLGTPTPAIAAAGAGHSESAPAGEPTAAAERAAEAAAAVRAPDFLEHLVDSILGFFGVKSGGNTVTHWTIAALLLVGSFLLRRVCTNGLFALLKRWAAKTETTLDDKLFPSLERPTATLISVTGAVAALKVLKLSASNDAAANYVATIAFSVVIFWIFLRAFNAVFDHLHELAAAKRLGIAAFMPWIKQALIVLFVVFGALMIAQSLGADVKAFLAGLGIGGLAFALAAQDTIANVFGSVVVAIDQPFKVGDFIKVGVHEGTVEDIGLRSTRLRTPARTLIVVPNKAMASEPVNNFTRMPQRRVDQTIGLAYAATPEQMQALLDALRTLLHDDPGVHPELVAVFFANYGTASLDLQIVYFTKDPGWAPHMAVRERINLAILRAVPAHGLAFASPAQTLHVATVSLPPPERR